MAVTTTKTNKPINPRGNDQSPLAFNRAKLYSGKALDFDGVNDSVSLDGFTMSGNNYSFAFCLKADAWNNFDYIFDIYSNRFIIASQPANNLAIYDGNSWQVFGEINDTTNTNFFTITIEGTISKAYLNGVQFGSTLNIESRDFSNATKCALMMAYDGTGLFFPGKMSGFKAFDVALTAAQVADLYNNPEKVVPTGVDNTALKLWLPMQEGAGTTAYDGSGNGNHGTISGATWTHGIGAPVSQTAVIDWNKGQNFFNDSSWLIGSATTNGTISSSSHSAPNGVDTAFIYNEGTGTTFNRGYKASNAGMAVGEITASTFVKKKDVDYINVVLGTEGGTYKFFALVDLVNGTIVATDASPTATSIQSVGDGWYYVSVQATQSSSSQGLVYIYGQDPTNSTSVDIDYTGTSKETYIWGINIQEGAINNVHLPTIGTLQSSDVLLPQGLTSGRDITGVNLFENVRKQGALNLDGNSWAEVHDNASLDITPAMTMECWVDFSEIDSTAIRHFIVKPSGATWATPYARYALRASNASVQWWFESAGYLETYSVALTGWNHIAVTKDGTAEILYINGAQVDTATNNATITASAENLLLGQATTGTEPLDSPIAQPRIYNRALTAEEIQRNFDAGKNTYTN